MRTNADMTVYNKITSTSESWQRTVIYDVAWEYRKAANVIKSGLIEADKAAIYIPWARGTNYLKPFAWQALASKTGKWTLQAGDIVVKGAVTDEITGGFTISSLIRKYDDVLKITSIDTMDMGSQAMWHWQVGAV